MPSKLGLHQSRLAELAAALPGSTPAVNRRPLRIPGRLDKLTLEQALEQLFPQVPRQEWIDLVTQGRLLAPDGKPAQLAKSVRGGEEFSRLSPEEVEPEVSADIRLLYEDEALIVIHKPAPLPMHPCGRFNRNSLRHLLHLVWQPEMPLHCHRLDSNTTGVLVCARSPDIARAMQQQFVQGRVSKRYLAKVLGHVRENELEINLPIANTHSKLGLRHIAGAKQGLASLTRFRVLARHEDGTSTLEVLPITGRTNQIRVHLWHIGHPILGDPAYLPGAAIGERQTLQIGDPPMHLHCQEIGLTHPISDQEIRFHCQPEWL